MTSAVKMRAHAALAAFAGLCLRMFLIVKFPMTNSGDTPLYTALGWNWLRHGVYGLFLDGRLVPVDVRAPGYPAFLAAVFAFAGNSARAVMLAQALVDVATCFVIAGIAARLAPYASRRRVALVALWLSALCPFTANYTAVVLTETLATFLTALAILVFLDADARLGTGAAPSLGSAKPGVSPWLLMGLVTGFAALVRPESPLLLLSAGLVLLAKWRLPKDWGRLARATLLLAAGLAAPLAPWAARNWRTLHEVQFLAPRYSNLPGEREPIGFDAWTGTWLWRFRDVYLTLWKLNDEEIRIGDIPASAFDSTAERERVARLLAQYNQTLELSPEQDREFGILARARTHRHPMRTHVQIPLLRSLAIWFTPRVELLPYSGQLWPPGKQWENDREDFLVTMALFVVNGAYVALALAGAWKARGRPGWALLVVYPIVRTAFFASFIETPEPRYVLECFPALIALAAQVFSPGDQLSSTGSG